MIFKQVEELVKPIGQAIREDFTQEEIEECIAQQEVDQAQDEHYQNLHELENVESEE